MLVRIISTAEIGFLMGNKVENGRTMLDLIVPREDDRGEPMQEREWVPESDTATLSSGTAVHQRRLVSGHDAASGGVTPPFRYRNERGVRGES